MKSLAEVIGLAVSALFFMVVGPMVRGYVFSILWFWFIVATFHLPIISIPVAIGISIIITFLTFQYEDTATCQLASPNKSSGEWIAKVFGLQIIAPFMTLGVGWIVHMFV